MSAFFYEKLRKHCKILYFRKLQSNKINLMKKFLLFILAMIVVSISFGQKKMEKKFGYIPRLADDQYAPVIQDIPTPVLNTKAVNEDVNRVYVGKSVNQRPFRREEARLVSYNADLDIISVALVLDPATYDEASAAGIVAHIYSTDHGATWSDPVVVNDNIADGPNYYISGSIFNPSGNTDVSGMYGVYQGTINPTSGIWDYKAYGSNNFGGDNLTNETFNGVNEEDGYWNIFGLSQIDQEMRCMNMKPEGPWGTYTAISFEPILGEYNGAGFDWDLQDYVDVDLIDDVDNEGAYWQGRWQGYDASTEVAWSADGQIGYMWVLGISGEEFSGVQPQVYYSDDAGDTWSFVFLDFQDDAMQALLEPFVIESNGGMMIPAFFESDGVVNSNGDLELFGAVGAHSADIFTYPDSIGWQWSYPGDIANFTISPDGLQDIIRVDSFLTDNVVDATEGNYCGGGWQHRIHAARNADGSQVFVSWIETLADGAEFNTNPDLFGWSKCAYMPENIFGPFCFTEGTLYEAFYYFNSSANLVYDNGNGYTLPTIQSVTPAEFATNTNAVTDPITINYVTGIEFPPLCTIGYSELEGQGNLNVAQNQPNPFTGTTTIEISSSTVANAIIEVSNIMGQTVYSINAGTVSGSKKVELNASDLQSGVYFYTVTVGNESITKKMIVE